MLLSVFSSAQSPNLRATRTIMGYGFLGLFLGLLLFGMAAPARAFTAGETLGTVNMGSDTTLSAAVYDSTGSSSAISISRHRKPAPSF